MVLPIYMNIFNMICKADEIMIRMFLSIGGIKNEYHLINLTAFSCNMVVQNKHTGSIN